MTKEELNDYHVGDTILDENFQVATVCENERGERYLGYEENDTTE